MFFSSIALVHMGNDRSAMPAETPAELRSTLMYKWVRLTEVAAEERGTMFTW